MSDDTNPKDLLGINKIQVGLLPAAGVLYGALAMQNGAQKYGPYNWRAKKVKMTIYLDAMERHIMALRDGEVDAADSQVPHLGHIIACAAILADAAEGAFLVDDRPLPGPASKIIEKYTKKPLDIGVPAEGNSCVQQPISGETVVATKPKPAPKPTPKPAAKPAAKPTKKGK